MSRRNVSLGLAAAALTLGLPVLPSRAAGLGARRMELKPFRNAPFPYRGTNPESGASFLDVNQGGRLGHTSPRGGIYWEDQTYSDNRVLLALPAGFESRQKALVVVYLHGNNATLERDVIGRQAIVEQVEASGLNAALVAPQLAVDALDSSAGRFWLPNGFHNFMEEASVRLGELAGDSRARKALQAAPIILVAYSGGYDPAAYAVTVGGEARVRGLLLFDAVFGEPEKFADWIVRHRKTSFFFSAYSGASESGNQSIARLLASRNVGFSQTLPPQLGPGVVSFYGTGDDVGHDDYMTDGWQHWPLAAMLSRIAGYARRR